MKPSAHIEYNRKMKEIKSLLQHIETGLNAHSAEENEDMRNYGYVGDLGHVKSELQNISDFINNEGEYES